MAETPPGIPNRGWFRASEVCELASIQPYVLRSWEAEFPSLGVSPGPGKPRLYRREDVEVVLRIKRLVLAEGLTLAGVRRRMEGELEPDAETVALTEVLGPEVRERLAEIRSGLKALLEKLSPAGTEGVAVQAAGDSPAAEAGIVPADAGAPDTAVLEAVEADAPPRPAKGTGRGTRGARSGEPGPEN